MPWQFPGYPHYLKEAAIELGLGAKATDDARRIGSLTRISTLLGQCTPATAPGILEQAEISLAALQIAYTAGRAMMAAAHEAFDPPEPAEPPEPPIVPLTRRPHRRQE